MSVFGLVKQIGVECKEVQVYIDCYFVCYFGVLVYMEWICVQVVEQGFVEILFGCCLYLLEIYLKNGVMCKVVECIVINVLMQGIVVDIMKCVMVVVDNWLQESGFDVWVIFQVYDELVLEVCEELVEQVCEGICLLMSGVVILDVLLVVEVGVGLNWDEVY